MIDDAKITKGKDMDEKIIETCMNCRCKKISLQKKKNDKFANIYLDVCYNCPYKHEFMIISGNAELKLPLEINNIYQIIEEIKKQNVYDIQENTSRINIHLESGMKISLSSRYSLIFEFLDFLRWSDKLKPLMEKLKTEMSYKFKKALIDKRKGI